ncbi:MAG TPA: Hsp20/alpha crystallin family protein [Bryobacteraceae bacterium]|jgi:HSP20 family protein|nr:Hsp20/alpha crystallin family protein [Bryobacteraceae bacterium]
MFDTMITRDIRQTLDDFRRSVDRLFSDFYNSTPMISSEYAFTPAVESAFTGNELFLRVILPGVTEQDVKVTAQSGRLVIEGERKAPAAWGENAWTKIPYGKFYAEIPVATGYDLEKVNCRLHDGVLDIALPVSEALKPRLIPIQAGESPQPVAASA